MKDEGAEMNWQTLRAEVSRLHQERAHADVVDDALVDAVLEAAEVARQLSGEVHTTALPEVPADRLEGLDRLLRAHLTWGELKVPEGADAELTAIAASVRGEWVDEESFTALKGRVETYRAEAQSAAEREASVTRQVGRKRQVAPLLEEYGALLDELLRRESA